MITDKVRNALRSFLRIEPAQSTTVTITERLDFNTNAAKNRIWYRGNGQELSELYRQISSDKTAFWSAVPTYGMEIRKVHTGIPRLMVDVLTSVVLADMNDIKLPDNLTDIWEEISRENNFEELLSAALSQVLYIGDGAFKISIDTDISQYPIIEFYPGDKVEFVYKRGRIREIIFKTVYKHKSGIYTLHEHYGYGYVDYKLYRGESECPLTAIPQTEKLKFYPIDNSLIMAVPFKIFSSHCYEGRGQSLFDGGKCDRFDALDEAWSQWLYAVRMSRPQKFLPPDYTPRNPYNGEPMKPNPFDNVFIEADGAMPENSGVVKPELVQPAIPHDSYLSTYITALDLCLQGIISPSTLGIDVKKLDNAEAQREKEKTTLYTRNKIVGALQNGFSIIKCTNNGMITGEKYYVGGIVGCSNGNRTISECTNSGAITGEMYVGGIVGVRNYADILSGCNNTGIITGKQNVGGIYGYDGGSNPVTNCIDNGKVNIIEE